TRLEGDRLFLVGVYGELVYDLTIKENRLLFQGKVSLLTDQPEPVRTQLRRLTVFRPGQEVAGPHVAAGGWVWGTFPFSRENLKDWKLEPLPALRPGQQKFSARECLQLFRSD